MPNETNFLDITLLGKEYRVACPPEERAALLNAAAYVDGKMRDIAEKTKSNHRRAHRGHGSAEHCPRAPLLKSGRAGKRSEN
jgi:hypothetical protein